MDRHCTSPAVSSSAAARLEISRSSVILGRQPLATRQHPAATPPFQRQIVRRFDAPDCCSHACQLLTATRSADSLHYCHVAIGPHLVRQRHSTAKPEQQPHTCSGTPKVPTHGNSCVFLMHRLHQKN
ncbi:MAG UNVERIFIED_CONTAM: hypothetical protein LVR18_46505 [Planctomycetaceae bacterium]